MIKRLGVLLGAMLLSVVFLSGCGTKENEEVINEPENENEETTNEPEVEEEENNNEDMDEETKDEANLETFATLISYMEDATDGEAEVIYENDQGEVYELDDMTVSLDAYTLVTLTDFHANYSIPFNDQTDGGVIIAKYTVTNDRNEDAYYPPFFYLDYTGSSRTFSPNRDLIPEEDQLSKQLSTDEDYLIQAGESVTGYFAYSFGQDFLDEALDVSTVTVEIPAGQATKDSFEDPIGKPGRLTLSLNPDGEIRKEGNKKFYNDRVTAEDMGEKEIIQEKNEINDTQALRDVNITLEGYQFTNFTPNEVEAPRFSNFTNGVVLLTVKFDVDNQGEENIGLSSLNGRLILNDGDRGPGTEGMLLNYGINDLIKVGETGEMLHVFVLDKEQYDKIWQDKAFEVELGPLRDENAQDISKGSTITFPLPK